MQYFLDAVVNRPQGVRGGGPSRGPESWVVRADGGWDRQNTEGAVGEVPVDLGEVIVSFSCAGAGYGPPVERDPADVLRDVIDGFVSFGRARDVYGVVLNGDPARWETLVVDEPATAARRAAMASLSDAEDDATRTRRDETAWWAGAELAGALA